MIAWIEHTISAPWTITLTAVVIAFTVGRFIVRLARPLLGLDLGYGIEGRSPEVYFEVGLTDF